MQFPLTSLALLPRLGAMLLCIWDIWAYRFTYHIEVFGVREENLSWYLTGIFIGCTVTSILGIQWGLSRFSRLWGTIFWICWLILAAYSPSFISSGHGLLFLIFPFLLLLPTRRESSTRSAETDAVYRLFTLLLALLCLSAGLQTLFTGAFNGHIFDSFPARSHSLNQWLATQTATFSWGTLWATFQLVMAGLLLYGKRRCCQIAVIGFLFWALLVYILFRFDFLVGSLLVTAGLLFTTTLRTSAGPEEESTSTWYNQLHIRRVLAWACILLFVCHTLGVLLSIRTLRRVPEMIGYNSQWDFFSQVSWYPHLQLEAREGAAWVTLIGVRGQRNWNTPEQVLLLIPATRQSPPMTLSPNLAYRMELLLSRWQIEWGDKFDRYRLVSHDPQYGDVVLHEFFHTPRAFEGSRGRD